MAAVCHDFEVVKLIIEEVDDKNPNGGEFNETPMHIAAITGFDL